MKENKQAPYLKIYLDDNLEVLKATPSESIDLIYIYPPFNTGHKQLRSRFHSENNTKVSEASYGYEDDFDDFMGFLEPRLREAHRILKPHGSLFFHIDYREVHYCKVLLDKIFSRESFINEIIWAYDYGARSKKKWSAKHDNILWYAKDPENYTFNYDDMDRIPYMAPGLVGPEKAARGKTPTDVWWHTIVSPNSYEKTGYATQKPRGIIDRIVKVHSNPGDILMDFFAGSGTFGESAYELGRNCILVDSNKDAIAVMKRRFAGLATEWIGCDGIEAAPVRVMSKANNSSTNSVSKQSTSLKRHAQLEFQGLNGGVDERKQQLNGIQRTGRNQYFDANGIRERDQCLARLALCAISSLTGFTDINLSDTVDERKSAS